MAEKFLRWVFGWLEGWMAILFFIVLGIILFNSGWIWTGLLCVGLGVLVAEVGGGA